MAACAAIYCAAARGSVATWAYMQAAGDAGDGDEGEATVAARLAALLAADMPFVVAEASAPQHGAAGAGAAPALRAGTLLGYACASPFRPREGWRFCCENSVYVSEGARRRGVGKCRAPAGAHSARRSPHRPFSQHARGPHPRAGSALLAALLPACAARGFRQVVAGVTVERDDGAAVGCGGGGSASPSVRLHLAAGFAIAGRLRAAGWKGGRWLDAVFLQRAVGAGEEGAPGAGDAPPDDGLLPASLRVPPARRQ